MNSISKVTEAWIAERRKLLPSEFLKLISENPGMPKSYYLFMSPEKGGLMGLTEDKYEALVKLVEEGKVQPGISRGKVKTVPGWYPAGHPDINKPHNDEQLEQNLLECVSKDPGKAFSYYCRLPLSKGGVPGSQERKEQHLRKLLDSGRIRMVNLPKPVGRKTHGIWPAGLPSEETQAIMSA